MSDIFISHVEEDAILALTIATGVEAAGFSTWYYERDSVPGPSYLDQIDEAIEECKAVVIVISLHSLGSWQVDKEVIRAHECGKQFIPVLLGVRHVEFQTRKRGWRMAMGANTSVPVPAEGVAAIVPRIVRGLEMIVKPAGEMPKPGKAPAANPEAAGESRDIEWAPPEAQSGGPKGEVRRQEEARASREPKRAPKSGLPWLSVVLIAAVVLLVAALLLSLRSNRAPQEVAAPAPMPTAEPTSTPLAVPAPAIAAADISSPPPPGAAMDSANPIATPQPEDTPAAVSQPAAPPAPEPGAGFTNSVNLKMVWISRLSIWVGSTEVTQQEYQQIMNSNPSHFRSPDYPVDSVTWNEAMEYCRLLAARESQGGVLPSGYAYRLPTDAEWSAFAAGTSLDDAVTSRDASREHPMPVASQNPNDFGLYDVRGNVWEWCMDDYDPSLNSASIRAEYHGLKSHGKVLRGGSWSSHGDLLLLDTRGSNDPGLGDKTNGFRVVLAPP